MSRDDSKLNFYSGWDIDQLVATNTIPISSGTSLVTAVPASLPPIPEYEVQFSPNGNGWFQQGAWSGDGTLTHLHSFSAYLVPGSGIYITTDISGFARYFIWSDKVDY